MFNGLILLLAAMILLVVFLYWNTRQGTSEDELPPVASDVHHYEAPDATPTIDIPVEHSLPEEPTEKPAPDLDDVVSQSADQEQDDLTKIEGIGPKIAGLLADGGISSYAGLAKTEISRLEAILEAAGSRFRLADPTSWPDQAHLAAEGDWDKLADLQDKLSGGREEKS